MDTQRRRPRWVYDGGQEPDPRFSLANERTFLAWIRTSLALLAAAAAVEAFDLSLPGWLSAAVATALAVTGLVAAVQAWRGWTRTEAALRRQQPLPSNSVNVLVVAGVAAVAVALVFAGLDGG